MRYGLPTGSVRNILIKIWKPADNAAVMVFPIDLGWAGNLGVRRRRTGSVTPSQALLQSFPRPRESTAKIRFKHSKPLQNPPTPPSRRNPQEQQWAVSTVSNRYPYLLLTIFSLHYSQQTPWSPSSSQAPHRSSPEPMGLSLSRSIPDVVLELIAMTFFRIHRRTRHIKSVPWETSTRHHQLEDRPMQRASFSRRSGSRPSSQTLPSGNAFVFN